MIFNRRRSDDDDDDRRNSGFDTNAAQIARVYDFWLGGKDNFSVDRSAAQRVIDIYPKVVNDVQSVRAFLCRVVTYMATEMGIRQFLDIGVGLPTTQNTHDVAQSIDPSCRVVYVDNDPIVLRHAEALLRGSVEGAVQYIDADLRDVDRIIHEAAETLDFDQPVALMLLGILPMIPDDDDPYGLVARLLNVLSPGSHLAISHVAGDIRPALVAEAVAQLNELSAEKITPRTFSEISAFFEGLEMVEPGVTQVDQWRSEAADTPDAGKTPFYCGVARKP